MILDFIDSASMGNEGLNTMANFRISTTSRSIDHKKKRMFDEYEEYVKKPLAKYPEDSFFLNTEYYHNIHV